MAFERAIINGNIVTGNESYLANIYIKDGKIALISKEVLEADEVTDASGKTVMSGFIDTHVHSRDGIHGAYQKRISYSTKVAGESRQYSKCRTAIPLYTMSKCLNPS